MVESLSLSTLHVKVENRPTMAMVTSKVSQGSVLFPIYANDMPMVIRSPSFMYPDDVKILRDFDSFQILVDLASIHRRTVAWDLSLDVSK